MRDFPGGRGVVRLTLLLFKHRRDPELLEKLSGWMEDLRAEVSRGDPGLQNLATIVQYLLTVCEQVSAEALAELFRPLGEEARKIPMTEGERLIEKGRQEGLQKGLQEGLQEGLQKGRQQGHNEALVELAVRLLNEGLAPSRVAELVGLPVEEVWRLAH